MLKEDVINEVLNDGNKTYSKEFVVHVLNKVTKIDYYPPKIIKKGDIIISNSAIKKRPNVVIKVFKDYCYAIPMTTTKDAFYLADAKTRFFNRTSYFTNSIILLHIGYCLDNFIAIYDNPRHLNIVIKELKKNISKI